MSILETLREHNAQKQFTQDNEKAIEMFDQQKEAILAIRNTAGYEEIKAFLKRGIDICENYLDSVEQGKLWHRVAGKRESYRDLLHFLENLEKQAERKPLQLDPSVS